MPTQNGNVKWTLALIALATLFITINAFLVAVTANIKDATQEIRLECAANTQRLNAHCEYGDERDARMATDLRVVRKDVADIKEDVAGIKAEMRHLRGSLGDNDVNDYTGSEGRGVDDSGGTYGYAGSGGTDWMPPDRVID